ncbi:hypothetical protein ACWJJH_13565 [Endozoicomonadaceae bacterium StTr2]
MMTKKYWTFSNWLMVLLLVLPSMVSAGIELDDVKTHLEQCCCQLEASQYKKYRQFADGIAPDLHQAIKREEVGRTDCQQLLVWISQKTLEAYKEGQSAETVLESISGWIAAGDYRALPLVCDQCCSCEKPKLPKIAEAAKWRQLWSGDLEAKISSDASFSADDQACFLTSLRNSGLLSLSEEGHIRAVTKSFAGWVLFPWTYYFDHVTGDLKEGIAQTPYVSNTALKLKQHLQSYHLGLLELEPEGSLFSHLAVDYAGMQSCLRKRQQYIRLLQQSIHEVSAELSAGSKNHIAIYGSFAIWLYSRFCHPDVSASQHLALSQSEAYPVFNDIDLLVDSAETMQKLITCFKHKIEQVNNDRKGACPLDVVDERLVQLPKVQLPKSVLHDYQTTILTIEEKWSEPDQSSRLLAIDFSITPNVIHKVEHLSVSLPGENADCEPHTAYAWPVLTPAKLILLTKKDQQTEQDQKTSQKLDLRAQRATQRLATLKKIKIIYARKKEEVELVERALCANRVSIEKPANTSKRSKRIPFRPSTELNPIMDSCIDADDRFSRLPGLGEELCRTEGQKIWHILWQNRQRYIKYLRRQPEDILWFLKQCDTKNRDFSAVANNCFDCHNIILAYIMPRLAATPEMCGFASEYDNSFCQRLLNIQVLDMSEEIFFVQQAESLACDTRMDVLLFWMGITSLKHQASSRDFYREGLELWLKNYARLIANFHEQLENPELRPNLAYGEKKLAELSEIFKEPYAVKLLLWMTSHTAREDFKDETQLSKMIAPLSGKLWLSEWLQNDQILAGEMYQLSQSCPALLSVDGEQRLLNELIIRAYYALEKMEQGNTLDPEFWRWYFYLFENTGFPVHVENLDVFLELKQEVLKVRHLWGANCPLPKKPPMPEIPTVDCDDLSDELIRVLGVERPTSRSRAYQEYATAFLAAVSDKPEPEASAARVISVFKELPFCASAARVESKSLERHYKSDIGISSRMNDLIIATKKLLTGSADKRKLKPSRFSGNGISEIREIDLDDYKDKPLEWMENAGEAILSYFDFLDKNPCEHKLLLERNKLRELTPKRHQQRSAFHHQLNLLALAYFKSAKVCTDNEIILCMIAYLKEDQHSQSLLDATIKRIEGCQRYYRNRVLNQGFWIIAENHLSVKNDIDDESISPESCADCWLQALDFYTQVMESTVRVTFVSPKLSQDQVKRRRTLENSVRTLLRKGELVKCREQVYRLSSSLASGSRPDEEQSLLVNRLVLDWLDEDTAALEVIKKLDSLPAGVKLEPSVLQLCIKTLTRLFSMHTERWQDCDALLDTRLTSSRILRNIVDSMDSGWISRQWGVLKQQHRKQSIRDDENLLKLVEQQREALKRCTLESEFLAAKAEAEASSTLIAEKNQVDSSDTKTVRQPDGPQKRRRPYYRHSVPYHKPVAIGPRPLYRSAHEAGITSDLSDVSEPSSDDKLFHAAEIKIKKEPQKAIPALLELKDSHSDQQCIVQRANLGIADAASMLLGKMAAPFVDAHHLCEQYNTALTRHLSTPSSPEPDKQLYTSMRKKVSSLPTSSGALIQGLDLYWFYIKLIDKVPDKISADVNPVCIQEVRKSCQKIISLLETVQDCQRLLQEIESNLPQFRARHPEMFSGGKSRGEYISLPNVCSALEPVKEKLQALENGAVALEAKPVKRH